MAILPVNLEAAGHNIDYATAQPVARHINDGVTSLYLMQLDGIKTEISINAKVKKNLKARGTTLPVIKLEGLHIYLLDADEAGRLFLDEPTVVDNLQTACAYSKVRQAGEARTITIGVNKAAESPVDADFEEAAICKISLPEEIDRTNTLLDIDYLGDVARLYANGKLIDDNFWNSRHFPYALWRLPANCNELELRILPLQKDMPVYFPSAFKQELEEGIRVGERVNKITIMERR